MPQIFALRLAKMIINFDDRRLWSTDYLITALSLCSLSRQRILPQLLQDAGTKWDKKSEHTNYRQQNLKKSPNYNYSQDGDDAHFLGTSSSSSILGHGATSTRPSTWYGLNKIRNACNKWTLPNMATGSSLRVSQSVFPWQQTEERETRFHLCEVKAFSLLPLKTVQRTLKRKTGACTWMFIFCAFS